MADAEKALLAAIARVRSAKTLKEACGALGDAEQGLRGTAHVVPPKGFERPFAETRSGLFMLLGVLQDQDCADGSGLDADTIRSELAKLRDEFARLQGVGAPP